MTLKKDSNFEEKLTFYLKNDMRNLVNFNLSSGKSGNLHFDGRGVTRRGRSPLPFFKIQRKLGKNALTRFIYGLNFSFKMLF